MLVVISQSIALLALLSLSIQAAPVDITADGCVITYVTRELAG